MAKRRQFSAEFKAKVALEALRGEYTLSESAKRHDVHPNMITKWKQQLVMQAAELFVRGRSSQAQDTESQVKELHAKIGQLTVERDFLKKVFER